MQVYNDYARTQTGLLLEYVSIHTSLVSIVHSLRSAFVGPTVVRYRAEEIGHPYLVFNQAGSNMRRPDICPHTHRDPAFNYFLRSPFRGVSVEFSSLYSKTPYCTMVIN